MALDFLGFRTLSQTDRSDRSESDLTEFRPYGGRNVHCSGFCRVANRVADWAASDLQGKSPGNSGPELSGVARNR